LHTARTVTFTLSLHDALPIYVLPEVGVVGDARAVVQPGLGAGGHALLVQLVHQDIGGRRQHDVHHHVGRVGAQGQHRRGEILAGAVQRHVLVLGVGRGLLQEIAQQLGLADAIVGVLGEGHHPLDLQGGDRVGHGGRHAGVVVARVEDFRIALGAYVVRPAIGVDVRHLVAMGHFDFRQAHRALVTAGDRHDLVAGDQFLGGGAAFFRDALVVFVDDLERPAQHAALVVDDLGDDLDTVLDLGALHDRPGRRLGNADADHDGVGRHAGGGPQRQHGGAGGGNEAGQLHGGLLLQERHAAATPAV